MAENEKRAYSKRQKWIVCAVHALCGKTNYFRNWMQTIGHKKPDKRRALYGYAIGLSPLPQNVFASIACITIEWCTEKLTKMYARLSQYTQIHHHSRDATETASTEIDDYLGYTWSWTFCACHQNSTLMIIFIFKIHLYAISGKNFTHFNEFNFLLPINTKFHQYKLNVWNNKDTISRYECQEINKKQQNVSLSFIEKNKISWNDERYKWRTNTTRHSNVMN